MASFTQGDPMPDVTTTQTTATTAPEWYNNYQSQLASGAMNAVDTGGVAGFSPLQTQAFANAPTAIQAGQPALTQATQTATNVATQPFMQNIDQYMNPYTQRVISEIGRTGLQNFQNRLAPAATAGAVGSGQFGSKRGMQVYGNVARESALNTSGLQAKYLAQGFDAATAAAKAQAELNLNASKTLGDLSGRAYDQGVGGLDVMSKLGAQQQAQEQAQLDYPMSALTKASNVMRGFHVPTSQTQTFKGPMPGAYQQSGLAQLLQILSTAGALTSSNAGGTSAVQGLLNLLKKTPSSPSGVIGGTTGGTIGGGTGGTGGDAGVGSDTPFDLDDAETGVGVDLTGGTGLPIDTDFIDFDNFDWSSVDWDQL